MYFGGMKYGSADANRAGTLLPRNGVVQVHFKVQWMHPEVQYLQKNRTAYKKLEVPSNEGVS